jgi:hypothetical protein
MGKRCLQSRPRGPAPKISPARKGWVHSLAVERRRCGTTLFVYSIGAYPDLITYEKEDQSTPPIGMITLLQFNPGHLQLQKTRQIAIIRISDSNVTGT